MTSGTPSRRTALGVGCTAHIVQDGLTATVFVLMPVLAQTFGLSYTQVGLIKGVKNLTQGVLEMASGLVTERLGILYTMMAGLAISGLAYIALSGANGILVITACLFFIGVGTAFQHAPASALIANTYGPDGRCGPLGIYNSSGDVGKLAFTGLFSLAIGAGVAWTYVSLAFGVIATGSALAFLLIARQMGKARQTEDPTNRGNAQGWGILDWRAFSALFGTVFLDTMVQAGVLVFVAFLMIDKGYGLEVATFGTVLLLIGGIFGKAGCGYLANKLGVRPGFGLIQVLTAIGLALVIIAPGWLAFPILIPLGAVVQGSSTITYAFVADLVHPDRMARGYALMYGASGLSAAAGPFAFGVIADMAGIDTAIAAMAVMSLLAIPPLYMMTRTQPA